MGLGTKISDNMRAVILAFMAISLLCLYALLVGVLLLCALKTNGCTLVTCLTTEGVISARYSNLLHTLQGLVSAIVIAVLAITPMNSRINLKFLGVGNKVNDPASFAQTLALLYVFIWIVTGGAALVVGHVILGETTAKSYQSLVDLGSAWLGLAVAATYAFFGIEPKS